jgi:hypothetical protein
MHWASWFNFSDGVFFLPGNMPTQMQICTVWEMPFRCLKQRLTTLSIMMVDGLIGIQEDVIMMLVLVSSSVSSKRVIAFPVVNWLSRVLINVVLLSAANGKGTASFVNTLLVLVSSSVSSERVVALPFVNRLGWASIDTVLLLSANGKDTATFFDTLWDWQWVGIFAPKWHC